MSRVHDLLVVGGGIAGTMTVLAAATRDLDTAWVTDGVRPADQSAHWHGHLHRGRLYDPVRERALIDELGQNVPFWWSNAAVRFHAPITTVALGPDERWAAGFRERLGVADASGAAPAYVRPDVVAVRTDEAILDGPGFLGTAARAASSRADVAAGRCVALRPSWGGAWEAEVRGPDGEARHVRARAVVLATGTAAPRLVPESVRLQRGLGARLSRMLVLRGPLPRAAAIVPSRSAGGLFFASRETGAGDRVWLVSDGFSSPGVESPGPLTDGWWVCSVLERLHELVDADVLAHTVVGGYHAAKSRVESSPTQVPAMGYALDPERAFVSLTPSKWSTTPTSAVHALAALIGDPLPAATRTLETARLLESADRVAEPPFAETWQTLHRWAPIGALLKPGVRALRLGADLLAEPPAATSRSVSAVA